VITITSLIRYLGCYSCPCFELDSVGKCSRYCLRSSKAFYCSGPQSIFVKTMSMVKNGKPRSASFTMNRFRDAMRPVSFWMSFLLFCGCIWVMALILSGFPLMPFVETKHPRTLPLVILNMHFSGLSLSLASRIFVKVSAKSEMLVSFFLLTTTMSSM
jgi:hypothetical protein